MIDTPSDASANTWDTTLARAFDAAFDDAARGVVEARTHLSAWDTAGELTPHQHRAGQVFEIIALALHRAGTAAAPSPSRQVFDKLLPQIAQDIHAVRLLTSLGFPYQAVTVAVSTFEHGVMLASIGSNDERAGKWLAHTDPARNMDNVFDTLERALNNLDSDFPGLKAKLQVLREGKLQGPYHEMYQPLCAFKHGNPVVQRHMEGMAADALPLSIFAAADRRAIIAAFWAIEAAIRAAWFALISFIPHHLPDAPDWNPIMRGINRAANELALIRAHTERK